VSAQESALEQITQTILYERQGRDRGRWDQMRAAFWPEATVALSWFSGSAAEFVTGSQRMSATGDRALHRLTPPIVHVQGQRAVAEVSAAVELRVTLQGVMADLISYTRLNYRLEQRQGRWGVLSLDAIYERDTLTPVLPGTTLVVNAQETAALRPSYALLAYYLGSRGYQVRQDLLGDDRPTEVQAFYDGSLQWLQAAGEAA
jgi:hypothetical protein